MDREMHARALVAVESGARPAGSNPVGRVLKRGWIPLSAAETVGGTKTWPICLKSAPLLSGRIGLSLKQARGLRRDKTHLVDRPGARPRSQGRRFESGPTPSARVTADPSPNTSFESPGHRPGGPGLTSGLNPNLTQLYKLCHKDDHDSVYDSRGHLREPTPSGDFTGCPQSRKSQTEWFHQGVVKQWGVVKQ